MSQSLVHPKPAVVGVPLGVLLSLTGAVLAAHWALLNMPGINVATEPPAVPRALTTRTIAMPDPVVAPTSPVAALASAAPRRAAPPKPPAAPPQTSTLPSAAAVDLGGAATSAEPAATPVAAPEQVTEQVAEVAPEPLPEPPPTRPPREDTLQARAFAVPKSVHLRYRLESTKYPVQATAELIWQHDEKRYDAKMRVSLLFREWLDHSVGGLGVEGLEPERFSEKRGRELASHFERGKGKIVFSANTPDAALLSGAQDRLSVSLQLAAMVAGDAQKFGRGTTVTIQVAGPREATLWLFTVEGPETLDLPIGEVPALKLQRNPRQPYDQKVELWLAPRYSYLPVRIRLTNPDGESLDQQLKTAETLD